MSTSFLASRKARIVLIVSLLLGVVDVLLIITVGPTHFRASPTNPWHPYFVAFRALMYRPVVLLAYSALLGSVLYWAAQPPTSRRQENTKLAVLALVAVSLESLLISWSFGL